MRKFVYTGMKTQKVLGLILAGGQGSRMGGADKGLLEYLGEPLISHVIRRLSPQCDDIIISANRNLESYQRLGYRIISDEARNQFHGPLAGICAGIDCAKKTNYSSLLVSSCDTPHLPMSYAEKMTSSIYDTAACSAVAHDCDRQQNIHCLLMSSAWDSLLDFYASGGRAMHQWHSQNCSKQVKFYEEVQAFKNINSLSDIGKK
ncbi:MAG: molybdenum cofactor guanylyltransferase [Gammaproteobacteria bacterium]|nr:molybdenum cofactor guanylyltransferase [Gammaproteobacteria bacterium]